MKFRLSQLLVCGLVTATFAFATSPVSLNADDSKNDESKTEEKKETKKDVKEAALVSGSSSSSSSSSGSSSSSKPAYSTLLKDFKAVDSMIPMYHKGNRLFLELTPSHYSGEYIVLISISRGAGTYPLYGGFSWGFGDDWVWKFRKIDDRVHIVRRNVRFKATPNKPEARAVKHAYNDSVLFSLPASVKGPKGGDLIDVTSVFMSDLPMISQSAPGFVFSSSKSVFSKVKGFPKNNELEVAATYASSGRSTIDSIADTRGMSINIHYSISKIPTTGYNPRLADDRIGYFLTVRKDFSQKTDNQFVRYINRWNLQKADPSAAMSEPKEPIIFYLENTIPYKYRKPIRDGILAWNKAFEKAGFIDAIRVRQMEDDATWDPEDINYNTFRWITSDAGFAMGPSRANPYTGQLLDADIIFDAGFVDYWKMTFQDMNPQSIAAMTGGEHNMVKSYENFRDQKNKTAMAEQCVLSNQMARQLTFAATLLEGRAEDSDDDDDSDDDKKDEKKKDKEDKDGDKKEEEKKDDKEEKKEDEAAIAKKRAALLEKMIMQGLKEVAMHEVGHTLGLRHNFKASKFRTLEEANDPKLAAEGMVSSVMDYVPANIVPKGQKQGDFFPQTIGPYDIWAIEYGYKQLPGGTTGEKAALAKIAARSGEPGHEYATDENTTSYSPDPDSNRFDFGKDAIAFANREATLVQEAMDGLVDRVVKDGDDYTKARRAFNVLLSKHGQAMYFVSRYIGGLKTSRSHKGDKDAKLPFEPVDVKLQREAMKMLEDQVFSDKPYNVDPSIYNQLASSNWNHWGTSGTLRDDFPIHDYINMWQDRVLYQLLSYSNLDRMHDTELKISADEDAFTTAELIERLTDAIFSEIDSVKKGKYTNRKPAISSLRRNLQRTYLKELSNIALGNGFVPQDCQTVAYLELTELKTKLNKLSNTKGLALDTYTKAHLLESIKRIDKVLNAELTISRP